MSKNEQLPRPARGERLTLKTDRFAFEGKSVARREEDGFVVFVEGALANESVVAEVYKSKSSFAEARLVEVLTPSPDRRIPPCPYFGTCGGCALQHMSYDAQCFWKAEQVRELLQRIGKFPDVLVHTTIADASREFHYRNKMEFSFSNGRWLTDEDLAGGEVTDRFALGLHVRNRFDRVLDITSCDLPHHAATQILNLTRDFTKEHGLEVFDADECPTGLMRFLVIKTSYAFGEVMVNIVTSRYDEAAMAKYVALLCDRIPTITTIVNNIQNRRAQVAVGDREVVLFGPGVIRDRIGANEFRISANSFFQANTPQAEKLYEVATSYADLRPADHVWDLYCGTGTISLFVAPRVRSVLGIEIVDAAIADAESNAKSNGVRNVAFVASDLRTAITSPEFVASHGRPDAMIIDPPRSGMHPDVIRQIGSLLPERIAYVSCNPATQARDCQLLSEWYDLIEAQPVDMFPQTYHIESVAKLRRKIAP